MMGWRECHGVETRITMTALSGRNDGVEGVNDGVEGVSCCQAKSGIITDHTG